MIPISEKDFLERRGDRQLRLGIGGSCPVDEVALCVHADAIRSEAAWPAVIAAANLLARWVPGLSIHMPEDAGRLGRALTDSLGRAVATANPFLEIRWGPPHRDSPSLSIGPGPPAYAGGVSAWSDGWVASSCRGSTPALQVVPITSVLLLAVSLSVGRVFRDVWGLPEVGPADLLWDTWQHVLVAGSTALEAGPVLPGPPELGRVLQIGAGAVGSNVIYFLGLMKATAELTVLDHDVVKVENLDRSLLFGLQDASPVEMPKVYAVQRATLPFPGLSIHPVQAKWADYAKSDYRVGHFDLVFALANEDGVWPAMADAVLPLTLQATTDRDWGVAFGSHVSLFTRMIHLFSRA